MTTTATTRRLRKAAALYAATVWPSLAYRPPTADELITMEIRADGYANAHVEGEHHANGICTFPSARDCGEAGAAAEYVETTDFSEPVTLPRGRTTHAACTHDTTKAARAACRRSSAPAIEEN